MPFGIFHRGGDEAHEHGAGLEWAAGELGMGLGAEEEGVSGLCQLEDLHDGLLGVLAGEDQA